MMLPSSNLNRDRAVKESSHETDGFDPRVAPVVVLGAGSGGRMGRREASGSGDPAGVSGGRASPRPGVPASGSAELRDAGRALAANAGNLGSSERLRRGEPQARRNSI